MSIRGTLCALTGGTYMADKNFLTDIIDADLAEGKVQQIHTRFPPEPNGYLHIGSAKAIYINWSIANQYGGKFNLRLDDTNPAREGEEYVNSIIEDLHWLGADPNGGIFYGSDYFDKCYEYAEKLITEGKAYVDDLTREEMREYRGSDAGKPSRPSPWRDRSPEENLDLFRRMRAGEFTCRHLRRTFKDFGKCLIHTFGNTALLIHAHWAQVSTASFGICPDNSQPLAHIFAQRSNPAYILSVQKAL